MTQVTADRCGDPLTGCTYQSGTSVFERQSASGPVDIRFASMHGTGTLWLATNAACVEACAPAGAYYYYTPIGGSSLSGAVTSAADAGTLQFYGPAPTIQ